MLYYQGWGVLVVLTYTIQVVMPKGGPVSSNWRALAPLIKNSKISSPTDSITFESKENKQEPKPDDTKGEELWFEVDEQALLRSRLEAKRVETENSTPISVIELFPKPLGLAHTNDAGKYIAMDCEMVGVGPDGRDSALARVSLVNFHGGVLLDRYVRPVERITDYRTSVSGIEPRHLIGAASLNEIQAQVWELLQGKILVGHSLRNDFRALLLEYPRKMTRDTSSFKPFRRISRGKSPSLKSLAKHFLGINIQTGSHDSVDDARVAMLLYRSHKTEWENSIFRGEAKVAKQQKKQGKAQGNKNYPRPPFC